MDRKGDPAAEHILEAPGTVGLGDAGGDRNLGRDVESPDEVVPTGGRPSNLVVLEQLPSHASASEVVPGRLCLGVVEKLAVIPLSGLTGDGDELCLGAAVGLAGLRSEGDAGPGCEPFNCVDELEVMDALHEGDRVATLLAAEAPPQAFFGVD